MVGASAASAGPILAYVRAPGKRVYSASAISNVSGAFPARGASSGGRPAGPWPAAWLNAPRPSAGPHLELLIRYRRFWQERPFGLHFSPDARGAGGSPAERLAASPTTLWTWRVMPA